MTAPSPGDQLIKRGRLITARACDPRGCENKRARPLISGPKRERAATSVTVCLFQHHARALVVFCALLLTFSMNTSAGKIFMNQRELRVE